jgi:hypothetical protein
MTHRQPIFVKKVVIDVFCPTFFAASQNNHPRHSQDKLLIIKSNIAYTECAWGSNGGGIAIAERLVANREGIDQKMVCQKRREGK